MLKIRQIYFDDTSKGNLSPCFVSYYNQTCSPFFENTVIAKLINEGDHDGSRYYGVLSHDILKDANIRKRLKGNSLFEAIAKKLKKGTDALILSPRAVQGELIFEVANRVHHPKFREIFNDCSPVSIGKKQMFRYVSYQNSQICRSDVYEDYVLNWLDPFMDKVSNHPLVWENSRYKKQLPEATMQSIWANHPEGKVMPYLPLHTFLCERLFSVYIQEKKINVSLW